MIFNLQEFIDDGNGNVAGVKTILVKWTKDVSGRWKMEEVAGWSVGLSFQFLST